MSKTILVIEDDLLIQELLVTLLESEGFATLAAEDGAEGCRLALQCRPDLVLSDLSLPGLDGLEVARRLSRDGLRVLAVTAHCRPEDLRNIEEAGFCGLLAKPVHPATFGQQVRAWL